MKLIELEINNIRGIPYLHIKPNGKSFVIWGPNGSGKSAVIDSIDFLLTGKISRLIGRGTGNISLSKHGPHVDYKPEDTMVRGIVKIDSYEKPIELKRTMSNPSELLCDKNEIQYIKPIIDIASLGQNVLTRREILKFITAESSTRAQEIQELLNISEIEEIRKTFVKLGNELKRGLQATNRSLENAKSAVLATLQIDKYNVGIIIGEVNKYRTILGGDPITELFSSNMKKDLFPLKVDKEQIVVNVNMLERDIQYLNKIFFEENLKVIKEADSKLRKLINKIISNEKLLKTLNRRKLVELGLELIDETGDCPLCDTSWPQGKLSEYLNKKLSTAQIAEKYKGDINVYVNLIDNAVSSAIVNIKKIIEVVQDLKLNEEVQQLQKWKDDLNLFETSLADPLEKYLNIKFKENDVKTLIAPVNINKILDSILVIAKKKSPKISKEQTYWDILTRLEENMKTIENTQIEVEKYSLAHKRSEILLRIFQKTRDLFLDNLYKDISSKFEILYRTLHGNDEKKFTASFKPEGAGLNFEVDFYNRGVHPPHALHSEGHQDSMGLCLFLSLFERLTEGLIDLIILDDVVMSVDMQHRRTLCSLFSTFYPNRQFFITTHDKTWAHQLLSEGCIKTQGLIEFYNWNIDTGPSVNYEADLWDKIKKDFNANDVSSAAARLRHGLEQFFSLVCDSLSVCVKFKLNSKWELGDLLIPAIDCYRSLLIKAIKSAESWNNDERVLELTEHDSIRSSIYKRTYAEQWAINTSVHYSNWANMGKEDFTPVVQAFQDLCGLFICSKCGSLIKLAMVGLKPKSIVCNCGKVDWNLVQKK